MRLEVRGDVDARAVEQLQRCAEAGDAPAAVMCADGHVGYSQPIGGAVAYRDFISPSGVGYDIGCGNKAVRTNIRASDVLAAVGSAPGAMAYSGGDAHSGEHPGRRALETRHTAGGVKNEASLHAYSDGRRQSALARIMDEIAARISFGMGRVNDEPIDHPVLDAIREADFAPQRGLRDLAATQLGTVGAGNHYVDLFRGDDGFLWVGVHFGSRGFGHKTASGFLALAQGLRFGERASEGEMDSPPILFDTDSDLGQAYIAAMTLAGDYAYAGRDVVVDKVLEILGAEATYEVHNHHNYAWRETHFGEDVWVIRKGCTPAMPGQQGFVGATMGEPSVILEGVESDASASLLYSTVHGAGRVMSRTQAAGKARKRWTCLNRDCGWFQDKGQHWEFGSGCPQCGHARVEKRMQQLSAGAIDWPTVTAQLTADGVELRGGAADEAPGAYKRLDAVLAHHADTIRVLHRLTPIGVAMAGPDTYDEFKD